MPGMSGSTSDTSSSQSGTQTTTPNLSDQFKNIFQLAQTTAGANGQSPDQTKASDFFTNQMGGANPLDMRATPWLQSLAQYTPGAIQQQGPLSTGNVGATTAASNMTPYQSLYGSGVIDPALAAYDQSAAQNMNARHAAAGAGSAFGDRAAVGDAVQSGQDTVGRAALAAQLGQQGFATAAGLGAGDSANQLAAGQSNAARALQGQEFSQNLSQQTSQQNIQNIMSSLADKMGIVNQIGANDLTGAGIQTGAASSLMTGGNEGMSNILRLLGITGANTNGSTVNSQQTGSQSTSKGGFDFSNPLMAAMLFGGL